MPRRRPSTRLPRARLALPSLSGPQALEIVNFLDRAIAAIWRVHGNAIVDCLADLRPPPSPRRALDPAASKSANVDVAVTTAAVAQTSLPL